MQEAAVAVKSIPTGQHDKLPGGVLRAEAALCACKSHRPGQDGDFFFSRIKQNYLYVYSRVLISNYIPKLANWFNSMCIK